MIKEVKPVKAKEDITPQEDDSTEAFKEVVRDSAPPPVAATRTFKQPEVKKTVPAKVDSGRGSKELISEDDMNDISEAPSEEFHEMTNRKADDTDNEEEEEEGFFIREKSEEKSEDDDGEVSDSGSNKFKINPETSAKPSVPNHWVEDLLGSGETENPILKGIQSAEKKYDHKKESNKLMTQSAGFSVEFANTSKAHEDSSEDDFDFRPAFISRKQKKRYSRINSSPATVTSNNSAETDEDFPALGATSRKNDDFRSRVSSFADSESSFTGEADKEVDADEEKPKKDGWSFEADDLDVNKLISEVTSGQPDEGDEEDEVKLEVSSKKSSRQQSEEKDESPERAQSCEKTPLEDVFKFDSELHEDMDQEEDPGESSKADEVSQEDEAEPEPSEESKPLSFAEKVKQSQMTQEATTEDESETETAVSKVKSVESKMTTSLNVTFDEANIVSAKEARDALASEKGQQSSTGGGSTSGNESSTSLGNSPNPKNNNKKKSKKKKKNWF